MNNSKKNIDRITEHAIHAAVVGNGMAAEETARRIDSEFILIRRSDLPKVEQKYNHSRACEIPHARTASYFGGDYDRYFQRALDYLAIAQVAANEKAQQAERELAGKREEAYRMLYPKSVPIWCYKELSDVAKAQIDVVVNLMNQVDTLKDVK